MDEDKKLKLLKQIDELDRRKKQVQARMKRDEQRSKAAQKKNERKLCYMLGNVVMSKNNTDYMARIVSHCSDKDQEWVAQNFPTIKRSEE